MRVSFADASFAVLDALTDVDALCLFLFEDERPLKGLAGAVDWRLCGGLSRVLLDARFVGAQGDALLLPSQGRLPPLRIFCFGAGRQAALDEGGYGTLCRKACEAMSLAGSKAFATELPRAEKLDEERRAKLFLGEGATRFKGDRMVMLGDGRELHRVFQRVAGDMKGLTLDKEPLGGTTAVVAPPRNVSGPKSASR